MGLTLFKSAYERLVKEDIEWLLKQPRSLEREHIHEVLKISPQREYDDQKALERVASFHEFLTASGNHEIAAKLEEFLGYKPERKKVIPT